MREIKFRIKNRDNDEFSYFDILDEDGINFTEEQDVTTTGEYTGLKDKNGKEIYEEDIVKFAGSTCDFLPCGTYEYHEK